MTGQQQRASELPLRIVDQPGGTVIRCLCGAELATLRRGVAALAVLRQAVTLPHLSPDITAAGLVVMVAHAKTCADGRRRAAVLAGMNEGTAAAPARVRAPN
jgi:hypothetical protein